VVTGSSGNFAQAIAYAGRELNVPVTVVMLQRSARYKVEAARQWGAEIVFSGNEFSERNALVEKIRSEQGKLLVHSFDDEGTIRGNGTLGFELLEQLPEVDVVLVPTSGGGLLAGVAAVVKQSRPETRIFGVQPENMPAMKFRCRRASRLYADQPIGGRWPVAALPGKLTFSWCSSTSRTCAGTGRRDCPGGGAPAGQREAGD
jgi:threonine dehydratase